MGLDMVYKNPYDLSCILIIMLLCDTGAPYIPPVPGRSCGISTTTVWLSFVLQKSATLTRTPKASLLSVRHCPYKCELNRLYCWLFNVYLISYCGTIRLLTCSELNTSGTVCIVMSPSNKPASGTPVINISKR